MNLRALLGKYDALASWLQSPLLFALRLWWGWSFVRTGWGKLMHLDRTAGYFASLHLPMPKLNAIMAGSTECFGGALLLVGLGSRLVSVPLAFMMLVAYLTAEREALNAIFSDTDKFVSAEPFPFLLVVLLVLAFGPGAWSLDRLLQRKR
ncbi:MAG: DoxX family protein [Opitutales bacterium]